MVIGTILVPRLWFDPLGPMLKIGSIMAFIWWRLRSITSDDVLPKFASNAPVFISFEATGNTKSSRLSSGRDSVAARKLAVTLENGPGQVRLAHPRRRRGDGASVVLEGVELGLCSNR
jgi:hypothetical protein